MPAGNLKRNFSLVAPRRKSILVPYAVVALLYVVVGALICWQGNAILGERQHAPDLYKGGCQCAMLLWFNDGQISWSNTSGFNLHSAWSHCPVPARPPLYGLAPPIAPGRWPNLNTRERFFHSQELERAVLRCILSDPVGSAKHAFRILRMFLAPQTWLHWNYPRDWILTPYRLGVWLSAAWLGVNLLVLFAYVGRTGRVQCIGHPENSLLLLTAGSLLMLALGNGIEQSRLLISLLPCLAAFPLPRLRG